MIRRSFAIGLAATLTGCATPFVQTVLTPEPGFAGPSIEPDAFVVDDGARLPYRLWAPKGEPWAVVVALHGMNDYSAAFRLAGPWWAEHGIATYAYDQRGFGRAPRRGEWAGEARMVGDLRTVTALVRARYSRARIAVVGESMGGSVAISAFASDRPPVADQAILLAPGVWGWSSQSPQNKAALWVTARLMGSLAVTAPEWAIRNIRASDNLAELAASGADPLFIRATRFDAVYGLVGLMESASRALGRTRVPTAMLYGAHDQIVERGPMKRALEAAGDAPNLRTAWYPDGWHLLNRDLHAEVVYRDVEALLRDPNAVLPSGAPPVLPQLQRR